MHATVTVEYMQCCMATAKSQVALPCMVAQFIKPLAKVLYIVLGIPWSGFITLGIASVAACTNHMVVSIIKRFPNFHFLSILSSLIADQCVTNCPSC